MILQGRVGDLDEDEREEHEDQREDELGDHGHVEAKRVVEPLEEHGQELLEPEDGAGVPDYWRCWIRPTDIRAYYTHSCNIYRPACNRKLVCLHNMNAG